MSAPGAHRGVTASTKTAAAIHERSSPLAVTYVCMAVTCASAACAREGAERTGRVGVILEMLRDGALGKVLCAHHRRRP